MFVPKDFDTVKKLVLTGAGLVTDNWYDLGSEDAIKRSELFESFLLRLRQRPRQSIAAYKFVETCRHGIWRNAHPSVYNLLRVKEYLKLNDDEYFELCRSCEQIPYEVLYLVTLGKNRVQLWKKLVKGVQLYPDRLRTACVLNKLEQYKRRSSDKTLKRNILTITEYIKSIFQVKRKVTESIVDKFLDDKLFNDTKFYYSLCFVCHTLPKPVKEKLFKNISLWKRLLSRKTQSSKGTKKKKDAGGRRLPCEVS